MNTQLILIVDFGGQYSQLIARRVRECGVYCEVKSFHTPVSQLLHLNPSGIILSGGPDSVYTESAPTISADLFSCDIPLLGICYGAQLMAHHLGGVVSSAGSSGEYGKTMTSFLSCSLWDQPPSQSITWMSHSDLIQSPPAGFSVVAYTDSCPVAAMENVDKKLYAVQFHPEVNHTTYGSQIIKNFLFTICHCTGDWNMAQFAKQSLSQIRQTVKDGKVLLALSGGVDSSVLAALLAKAIGKQLTCIFVDHGLMRKQEGDEIEQLFEPWPIKFIRVNAAQRFLTLLSGIQDPETKRKRIGEEFIRVFEEEAKKIGCVDFFAQGTIYPDVIESGEGQAAVIKSHHNVGGLPEHIDFKDIIEPLRLLFKDEVRALGTELGLSDGLVWRQPFPGPGLAVRIIGEITAEKVEILQQADAIFREEIAHAQLDRSIHQYFAVLTSMRSVGVMGDVRTYDYTIALRGVVTSDFMTADFARIPYPVLDKISTRIVNEVSHINRIVYDITTKPPATIEWE